jgi:hypothetical protein
MGLIYSIEAETVQMVEILSLCSRSAALYERAPRRLTKRNLTEVVWIQGSGKNDICVQHQVGFVNFPTSTHTETSTDCYLPVLHLLSVVP